MKDDWKKHHARRVEGVKIMRYFDVDIISSVLSVIKQLPRTLARFRRQCKRRLYTSLIDFISGGDTKGWPPVAVNRALLMRFTVSFKRPWPVEAAHVTRRKEATRRAPLVAQCRVSQGRFKVNFQLSSLFSHNKHIGAGATPASVNNSRRLVIVTLLQGYELRYAFLRLFLHVSWHSDWHCIEATEPIWFTVFIRCFCSVVSPGVERKCEFVSWEWAVYN